MHSRLPRIAALLVAVVATAAALASTAAAMRPVPQPTPIHACQDWPYCPVTL